MKGDFESIYETSLMGSLNGRGCLKHTGIYIKDE